MCSGTSSVGSATSPSGNSGKSRTSATGLSLRPELARTQDRDHDRPRLVPARPARPRPPGADRRAPRVRPRRAGLRPRPAAARRALPVPQPRVVPPRLPGASCARRSASAAPTSSSARAGRRRSCRRSRASAARPRSTSPPTSRRSRWRATAAWPRRWASRSAARPGLLRRRRRRAEAVLGLHAVLARVAAAAAPRGPRRAARPALPERARGRAACRRPRSRRRPTRPGPASAPPASACTAWLADGLDRYEERHDRLAGGTSGLSPYLHFGCISRARARGARARARRRGVRPPARLARLLRPRPAAPPGQRPPRATAASSTARVGRRRGAARRLARGPHRLSRGRRRDAPAARHRLDAQPRAG